MDAAAGKGNGITSSHPGSIWHLFGFAQDTG